MAQPVRTLEKVYNIVRDRLGILHEGNMNYQEATFMADANNVGKHLHSLLIAAGDNFYDSVSGAHTIAASTESSDLFPAERNEVSMIRRIWLLNDSDELETPLQNRRVDRTDIYTGSNPSFEVIDNRMYWFPPPSGQIKVKVEYVRHYNTSPVDSGGASDTDLVDETGDTLDIPEYADDYFINELTVRAAMATGKDPSPWMNIAMRSRETMVMNAARNVPRRKWVLYGGR